MRNALPTITGLNHQGEMKIDNLPPIPIAIQYPGGPSPIKVYKHTYIHSTEWRSFHNELRTSPQRNTIDGDLVERILDMDKAMAEVVAGEVTW